MNDKHIAMAKEAGIWIVEHTLHGKEESGFLVLQDELEAYTNLVIADAVNNLISNGYLDELHGESIEHLIEMAQKSGG